MVDVQLAVDALTHGFNKNMTLAVFLAGDLDFRPVVDALVDMGIYTEVIYEPSSASRNLYRAGDGGLEVDLFIAHQWSTADFKRKHPFPLRGNGRPKSSLNQMIPLKVGNVGNVHAFAAQEAHGPYWIWVDSGPHGEQYAVTHMRLETLEAVVKYFHLGMPIVWTKEKGQTKPPVNRVG